MGALDFLFEGRPPPSTTTYGTTSTDMPRWLSDYTQGLITKANAIAAEPYQNYEGPRLASMTDDQTKAFDITRGASGLYTPWITGAQEQAKGALGSVMPMVNNAARSYTGATVGEYMNPYVENVINRGSQLAERTLNEKFLPGVSRVFGASGSGPRSTQMRRTVDQGVRDLTEGLNAQNQAALASAYETGAQTFGSDAARQGALAGTVGNLALNSAQTQAGLADQSQNLALRDAAAMSAVGEAQQADQQRSLDLAYEDFARQRDYPRTQADWLSSIIRGMPYNQTTTSNETGPANVYQPSKAAQLGSLVTTGMGIWDMFKKGGGGGGGGLDLGGLISQMKRGGRVRYKKGGKVMKGALCYA